jgi:hypothetical protein
LQLLLITHELKLTYDKVVWLAAGVRSIVNGQNASIESANSSSQWNQGPSALINQNQNNRNNKISKKTLEKEQMKN